MAVMVSNLAARVRTLAVTAMARARTTESLYAFSRKLAGAGTLDDVLWATAYQTALDAEGPRGAAAAGRRHPSRSRPAIRPRTCSMRPILPRPNGPGSTTGRPGAAPTRCPARSGCFCPCARAAAPIGVVGIDSDKPGPLLTPDQRRLLDALIDQAALAIERIHLVDDLDQAKRTVEAERLRAALLTSISHDLKTPLAVDPRRRQHAQAICPTRSTTTRKADLVATIIEEVRAAQPLHRQSARHDEA